MHVLFICHANMCRSAFAEGAARQLAAERELPEPAIFHSAGLWTQPGLGAIPEVIAVAAEYGIDLEAHETTPFCLGVADRSDYLVAMTRAQKREIGVRLPMMRPRAYTFAEFVAEMTGRRPLWRDVADPTGKSLAEFRKCTRRLYDALALVLDVCAGTVPRKRGFLR